MVRSHSIFDGVIQPPGIWYSSNIIQYLQPSSREKETEKRFTELTAQVQVTLPGNLEENTPVLFIFIGGRKPRNMMIPRLDAVVCWCGTWFLVLFCYLIGDSYSSSANGRNGTWVLVRRCFPSFGGFALELAELADFGREAVLVELTPTWHGRRETSAPKRTTRINRAMKGTRSFVGVSDQHQPNTRKIFRILKWGWGSRGGHTGMICPHPQAIEHQGRMAQSALDESQRRQAWRLRPCCWEGLAWLAFKEIRGISP